MEFYKADIQQIYRELGSSEKGISSGEAKARLEKFGYNRLEEKKKVSPIILFLHEFNDPVVWVLLAALVISSITGYIEYSEGKIGMFEFVTEPIVIGAIVILNAIIGFVQEFKAEKAIEALRKMTSHKAVVIRDGEDKQIDAVDVVPGDVLI